MSHLREDIKILESQLKALEDLAKAQGGIYARNYLATVKKLTRLRQHEAKEAKRSR